MFFFCDQVLISRQEPACHLTDCFMTRLLLWPPCFGLWTLTGNRGNHGNHGCGHVRAAGAVLGVISVRKNQSAERRTGLHVGLKQEVEV